MRPDAAPIENSNRFVTHPTWSENFYPKEKERGRQRETERDREKEMERKRVKYREDEL